MKAGIISLGCSKNRVDTELLLGALGAYGFAFTPDAAQADVLIVNTCGFITPAKQESINTVLEMAQYKKTGKCKLLVMCGCMAERYPQELREELPEVDLFWGVKEQAGLAAQIAAKFGLSPLASCRAPRILTTPPYSAYLRIADGCDNRCTYCAIPLIRGPRASVPMETLLAEAERLAAQGVIELTLIAQDTSAYGIDLYGEPRLAQLLQKVAAIPALHWVRVLYTYPDTVDQTLIDTIAENPKIANYIDMPIQHIDDDILQRMNRRGSAAQIETIVCYIRERYPDFILRTTVMTGFPGESEEQFGRLTDFLQRYPFDRLGAFAYSPEEGTPSAEYPGQLPEAVKEARLDQIMRMQRTLSLARNKTRIGKTCEVLVEQLGETEGSGRSFAEAPEVDGMLRFTRSGKPLAPGEFTTVRIQEAGPYDLIGEEI